MNIISIGENTDSPYIIELRNMLEQKWRKFSPFEDEKGGVKSPPAIIALKNNILLGGLVFSVWKEEEQSKFDVWINGLIVKPEYRGTGIASKLIREAMTKAPLLFTKTDVENLYLKNGWTVHKKDGLDTILNYQKLV